MTLPDSPTDLRTEVEAIDRWMQTEIKQAKDDENLEARMLRVEREAKERYREVFSRLWK